MKAFVCLFDWLVWQDNVDPVRRLTPYIKRFPPDYEAHLADPEYWPSWDELITDYLEWNPSRNRALDMLPLFSEIDAEKIKSEVDDSLIKAEMTGRDVID